MPSYKIKNKVGKHADHTGELKSFPNAKIYVNAEECDADELKGLNNIIPVQFTDGPYYTFMGESFYLKS